METIIHKNRQFKVIEKTHISALPNIAAANPELEFSFIAKGANGAFISGWITKNGNFIIF